MPKAIVLGATGHIGSYLVPQLVDADYEVLAVSRGTRDPYTKELAQWQSVQRVCATRAEAIQTKIDGKTDLVCDLLPYTREDAEQLVRRFQAAGIAQTVRLISIGSIWIYDKKYESPVTESHPRTATDAYGQGKAEIERYLLDAQKNSGLRVTILHPGHICGSGWMPVGPLGNRDPQVIRDIMNGNPVLLPDSGQATLHHVHAEDIAGLTLSCLNKDCSIGEQFHSVCPTALTLFGYTEQLYRHFNQTPAISYTDYESFLKRMTKENADVAAEHIDRSPMASMDKAWQMLGFIPKHSAIDTVLESIDSILDTL